MRFYRHAPSENRVNGHRYFNLLVQTIQNCHQPINGETAKIGAPYPREIRGGDASQGFGLSDRQSSLVKGMDDCGRQERP